MLSKSINWQASFFREQEVAEWHHLPSTQQSPVESSLTKITPTVVHLTAWKSRQLNTNAQSTIGSVVFFKKFTVC